MVFSYFFHDQKPNTKRQGKYHLLSIVVLWRGMGGGGEVEGAGDESCISYSYLSRWYLFLHKPFPYLWNNGS